MSTTLPPEDKLDTLILCILDGWGLRNWGLKDDGFGTGDDRSMRPYGGGPWRARMDGDAIILASRKEKSPHWNGLYRSCLRCRLQTSGESVGLPYMQMGNSEVGHLHIGAGRVVKQSLKRIDEAIANEDFFRNEGLRAFAKASKERGSSGVVHVAGIVSSGGVHGSDKHVLTTLKFFHERGLQVRLHAFLDGRDTKPQAAIEELPRFLDRCEQARLNKDLLASVVGRYYAMDRDMRWERTELAFRAMAFGEGERIDGGAEKVEQALARRYESGEGDEFMLPLICGDYGGFAEGDALFFTNFRDDRTRQIAGAITAEEWCSFSRGYEYKPPHPVGSMMPYGGGTAFEDFYTAFKKEQIKDGLGEVVSKAGLKQLRIAETEKFAHVTYFFNGGREETIKGEEWHLIPSPQVATYDLKPEMSARKIAEYFMEKIQRQEEIALFVLNFANPDMVGHTGNLEATVEAIAEVDICLGLLRHVINAFSKKAGLMIFADHGNAEKMLDENGKPHTAHTTNPVPLVVTGSPSAKLNKDCFNISDGSLIDIAPTALYLLGLEQPAVMTGRSLLTKKS